MLHKHVISPVWSCLLIITNTTCLIIASSPLSIEVPRPILTILQSTPIMHILILQLCQTQLSQLEVLDIDYPVSQLLFLSALILTLIARNYIHRNLLTVITMLYVCMTNLQALDLLSNKPTFGLGSLILLFETVWVGLGLVALDLKVRTTKNGYISKKEADILTRDRTNVYLVTCVANIIGILVYTLWFYNSQISQIPASQHSMLHPSAHQASPAPDHNRHNAHPLILTPSSSQFYQVFWGVCSIVAGTLLGSRIHSSLQGLDNPRLGLNKKEEDEEEHLQGMFERFNEEQQLVRASTKQQESERAKFHEFLGIAGAYGLVCCRWAAQFVL